MYIDILYKQLEKNNENKNKRVNKLQIKINKILILSSSLSLINNDKIIY